MILLRTVVRNMSHHVRYWLMKCYSGRVLLQITLLHLPIYGKIGALLQNK